MFSESSLTTRCLQYQQYSYRWTRHPSRCCGVIDHYTSRSGVGAGGVGGDPGGSTVQVTARDRIQRWSFMAQTTVPGGRNNDSRAANTGARGVGGGSSNKRERAGGNKGTGLWGRHVKGQVKFSTCNVCHHNIAAVHPSEYVDVQQVLFGRLAGWLVGLWDVMKCTK